MIEISISPVAFLTVRWYGIMVALAILAIILWVARQIKKGADISLDTLLVAALVGIPSGVVVSRLLHVLDMWDYYSRNPGQIIGGSGLTIYGAIIGAALGIWVYSRLGKFKFGYMADLITPGLILSQIVGRIGCTINGCCFGSTCSVPWAIVYTHPDSLGPIGIAVHPTQVYEIIFLAIVFIIFFFLRNKLKPDGSLFIAYLGLYGLWRLGIDFIRDGTPFLFGLHQAQVIGIITLVIVIPLLALRTRWSKAEEKSGIPEELVPAASATEVEYLQESTGVPDTEDTSQHNKD